MERSHCYNPFMYLETDNDVQKLVTNLFKSTEGKDEKGSDDPFWNTAAQMLLLALMFYLRYEAPEYEQNFAMVLDMIRAGEVSEEDESKLSALDCLFYDLEDEFPDHIAVKYYKNYHSGAARTLKSIQITLISKLKQFNLEQVAKLTMTDEMNLNEMGERKIALFAIIPDNDTSFNFIVSILYTQLFQQLFYVADYKYGGTLPIHVHFIMDEFSNVSLPGDFEKILSVMRSRGVSVSIILQNLAQIKALFKNEHESIIGNCDEFLYLGGNEPGTHKYISELLGKETIDTTTFNHSKGRNGNYTTNYQYTGRELLDSAEVRLIDNAYALLFIRGERPVRDLKYDITKHPNFYLTLDGKGEPFVHGVDTKSIADIELVSDIDFDVDENIDIAELESYELLSEEGVADLYEEKEDIKEEKKNEKVNEEQKGREIVSYLQYAGYCDDSGL